MQGRGTPVPAQPRVVKRPRCVVIEQPRPSGGGPPGPRTRICRFIPVSERVAGTRRYDHRPGTFVGWDAAETRRRRGMRSDEEMSLCSFSSAVAGALGKLSYHRITGPAEGTKEMLPGAQRERLWVPLPLHQPWSALRRFRCLTGWGVTQKTRKRIDSVV